jgi:hypothetical protein
MIEVGDMSMRFQAFPMQANAGPASRGSSVFDWFPGEAAGRLDRAVIPRVQHDFGTLSHWKMR